MTTFVVVPCFNEAFRWSSEYWDRLLALSDFRWIFVDDGSSDNTGSLIRDLCRGTPNHLIVQRTNLGKAEAVRSGMLSALSEASHSDIVGFVDADGAFKADDIARLARLLSDWADRTEVIEAVWSSRVALAGRDIRRTPRRHYLGRVAATVLSWGDAPFPYDTQSGLKFFRPTPALHSVLNEPFRTRWLFEVEMLQRFRQQNERTMKVWEEPVNFWQDVTGSKVSSREVLRIGREILFIKSRSGKIYDH